jgi:hypothetical protein
MKKNLFLFILFILLIFCFPLFAEKINPRTITLLDDKTEEYQLGLALEIDRDTISKSFEDIKSSTRFQESKQVIPNYGFTP